MKISQISNLVKRFIGGFMLICIAFISQARQLVISHGSEVKYILQDHQTVNLKLTDGTIHKGMLTIESDSSLSINGVALFLNQVDKIKVKEGSSVGKGVGIVGLAGGTGLIGVGLSLLAQDDGLIIDLVNLIIAIPLIAVGVVIDAISISALALSGGKWITVSRENAKHQLSIV
jgi:hypothetical protein